MIGCAGGCGLAIFSDDLKSSGWSYLQITKRWRCGACERELVRMSTTEGAPPRLDVDKLDPTSMGALKTLPERPPLREVVKP
jgi:hypothetical protein